MAKNKKLWRRGRTDEISEFPGLSGIEETENLLELVLDHIIHHESDLLASMQEDKRNEKTKEKLLRVAEEQFNSLNPGMDSKTRSEYLSSFERYLWGYHILDRLIDDMDISDIKTYDFDHIQVKRLGKRMPAPSDVKFQSREDYKRLVDMAAAKNQINLSTLNAIRTFTDEDSSPDFILRFDICTEYINTSKVPMMQIRKFPKHKYTLQELIELQVMTPEQAEYLDRKAKEASGIFWTGKGGSGKSICMNTMLDRIPHDKSALVLQENQELFSDTHPDMLIQRIRTSNGEGRVQYGLKELATNGLLLDLDYYIISEIKGSEAAEFAQASYTGHICWASGHGRSAREGLYKCADNIKRATSYEYSECLRLLSGMEVVVFMKDFQVAEIAENHGYDEEKKALVIQVVDLPKPPPRE